MDSSTQVACSHIAAWHSPTGLNLPKPSGYAQRKHGNQCGMVGSHIRPCSVPPLISFHPPNSHEFTSRPHVIGSGMHTLFSYLCVVAAHVAARVVEITVVLDFTPPATSSFGDRWLKATDSCDILPKSLVMRILPPIWMLESASTGPIIC